MHGPLVGSLYTVSNPGIRICVHVFVGFLAGPAFRIGKVFARLKLPLFEGDSSHLLLQIKTVDGNTGFCKHTGPDTGEPEEG